jgi:soluble lytic murein transglycosylase-like protein
MSVSRLAVFVSPPYLKVMWIFFVIPMAIAGDVWRAEHSDGSVSFTDSPSSAVAYAIFDVEGPPPKVGRVNLKSFPSLDTFDGLITAAAHRYTVEPSLIKAVVLAESGMNPNAVSRSGAQGLMQLMPPTAADLGVTDPFDPAQCIDGGTRYIAKMLNIFQGDLRLALAGYNAGPNRVKRTMTVPNIPETQTYVKRVLALRRYFKNTRPIIYVPERP